MTYRYQLKLKSSRECVDLREYKGEITSAVRIGLGNKNVKVVVRKEYYQFCYEKEKVTHGVLVKIGRGITRLCLLFGKLNAAVSIRLKRVFQST